MYYGIVRADNTIRVLYEKQGILDVLQGEKEIAINGAIIDLIIAHHEYDQATNTITRKSDEDIAIIKEENGKIAEESNARQEAISNMKQLLALRALKTELGVNIYDDEISALEAELGV